MRINTILKKTGTKDVVRIDLDGKKTIVKDINSTESESDISDYGSEEISEPSEVEVIPEPGTLSQDNRRVGNNNLLLTYETHIPKDAYKTWVKEVLMPRYCSKGYLDFLEVAHELADEHCHTDHTHVLICVKKAPIRTRDTMTLDWNIDPNKSIISNRIHPSIRMIKGDVEIRQAKRYISKQDRELSHLLTILAPTEREALSTTRSSVGSNSKRMAAGTEDVDSLQESIIKSESTNPVVIQKMELPPSFLVKDFERWQIDVLELMDKNSCPRRIVGGPSVDPARESRDSSVPLPGISRRGGRPSRCINVIHDPKGNSGKKIFMYALKYEQSNRFLAIRGVPDIDQFKTILIAAKKAGWTGDTIIFNTREKIGRDIYSTLEASIDELYVPNCRNVWLFIPWIPDISRLAQTRWRFYHIFADWSKDMMSFLEPLTMKTAQATYNKERLQR